MANLITEKAVHLFFPGDLYVIVSFVTTAVEVILQM